MLLWSTILVRSAIRLYVCFTNHCADRIDIGPIAYTVSDVLIRNRARARAVPDRTINLFMKPLPLLSSVARFCIRPQPPRSSLSFVAYGLLRLSLSLSLLSSLPLPPPFSTYPESRVSLWTQSTGTECSLRYEREIGKGTRRRIVACTSSRIVTRIYLHDNGAHG